MVPTTTTAAAAEETPSDRIERAGPLRRALLVWGATVMLPTGAWAAHLLLVSSVPRLTCNDGRWSFLSHAATAVTLLVVLVSAGGSWRLARAGQRSGGADASAPTAASRQHFLGLLGIGVCAFNFALIALEEVYVVVLHGQRCG